MLRTVRFFGFFAKYLLLNYKTIKEANTLNENGDFSKARQSLDTLAEVGMKKLLKISGAQVSIKGSEHVLPIENYLFVANHQGNFDIPLLFTSSPVKMAFVAKKEMARIPLLSKVMKARGCIFLDRTNPRNAVKDINAGAKFLEQGESLAIFPEGTRSKSSKVGQFKAGGLKLALKTGVKIIPVTIKDSFMLMEYNRGRIKPHTVEVIFSEPVDSTEYKDAVKLANDLQTIIEKNLKKT